MKGSISSISCCLLTMAASLVVPPVTSLPARSSSHLLREYLNDSVWSLRKRLEYRRGGAFGKWTGTATFTEDPVRCDTLLYTEEGFLKFDTSTMGLGGSEGIPSSGRPLAFVFPADSEAAAEVHFVEEAGFRFFHKMPFSPEVVAHWPTSASCSFEHLCVKDLYSGCWTILDEDRFQIRWHVFGPTKDGDIVQEYERQEPPGTLLPLPPPPPPLTPTP
jgi:hypothetical protein